MNQNSIYYLFDPNSPGWIRRRLANGEFVSVEDIRRVVSLHPECRTDAVILAHCLRLTMGEVAAKKGRPANGLARDTQIWFRGELVREQIALWREGIGEDVPRTGRGEPSLSEAAWDKYALPMGMSGRGLRNAVGALKYHRLLGA